MSPTPFLCEVCQDAPAVEVFPATATRDAAAACAACAETRCLECRGGGEVYHYGESSRCPVCDGSGASRAARTQPAGERSAA